MSKRANGTRARQHEYEHEYEPAHESPSAHTPVFPFPHQRLDAYHVSLQLVRATKHLSTQIPRGYRNLADQLNRACAGVVLNLSEGANRFAVGDKRQCFCRASGECGEVAAAAELATVLELVTHVDAEIVIKLAGRIAAMLTGLIKRLR